MTRFKGVVLVIIGVVLAYLSLLMTWGPFVSITTGVADEMAARPGIANYFGVVALMRFIPWLALFVPAIVGIIAVVLIFKRKEA